MGVNAISIGGISQPQSDPEYADIIRRLRALGLEPCGDKAIDKNRLKQAEQKIESAKKALTQKNDPAMQEKEKAAAAMTGASNLADLNKILLGL